jgi:hypothetical protein
VYLHTREKVEGKREKYGSFSGHMNCCTPPWRIMMKGKRIETFDDWKDVFGQWQCDINYDSTLFTSVLDG